MGDNAMSSKSSPFPPQSEGDAVTHEERQYAAGHIPGASNLPMSRFDPAELPKGKPIVLVCQSGARSAKALNAALAAGVKNVRHYAPGTGGWRARGGPVVT
jgi:rhodanese-related sulfurtransferase